MSPSQQRELLQLRRENQDLQARIAQIRRALTETLPIPQDWRLTRSERVIFGVLVNREVASKDAIMTALYSARAKEEPDVRVIDALMCKMRRKIAQTGPVINTICGVGYTLDPETRRAFRTHHREAA